MPYSERLHGTLLTRLVACRSMRSLQELRHLHPALLVLDAASSRIQAGWLTAGAADRWTDVQEDAGQGVFSCIARLGCELERIEAFVFCEGPGSILGIRTVAMAIRTWQAMRPRPAYSYRSLDLVAHALALERRNTRVIADARRETWHVVDIDAGGSVQPLIRVPHAAFSGDAVTPEHFRAWAALPAHTQTVPYDLPRLFAAVETVPLLQVTPAPDAFTYESPQYVTWSPKIHRAPS